MNRKAALATLVTSLLAVRPAAAADEEGDSGDTIVNIDLDGVIEAIEDLTNEVTGFIENWGDTLFEVVTDVIYEPFIALLKLLVTEISAVLLYTPDVYPNPAVTEIHHQTLLVTYLLATLAFMIAGLLYIIGPVLGISYQQVRMIFPRIIIALVFASVSLPLLQYMIDLTNALVIAFKPASMDASLNEMYGTGITVLLAYVINSWLLLVVVLIFIVRAVYILFVAAISPLIALAWSLPRSKRYADSFIAGWFTALAMAPLDMIVLKFSFTLMSGTGFETIQGLSNWLYGMASAVLLIWVPYQLYGASQAAVGQAYSITRSVKGRVKKHRRTKRRNHRKQRRQRYWQRQERKWDQYRQERLEQHNRPNYRGGDHE